MTNTKRIVVMMMLFVILSSLLVVVYANPPLETEEIDFISHSNPHDYATVPDGLYVFIYQGTAPYLSVEIDTTTCVEGRMYVFDSNTEIVTEISDKTVMNYTCNQDALFFVTSSLEVYKTDYLGQGYEYLYKSESDSIANFENYLDTLYFVESGDIVFLNYQTKETQKIWTCEDIDWVFRLNDTELVVATIEECHYLYDILSNTATQISGILANDLITVAVTGDDMAGDSGISLMSLYSPSIQSYENDVTLPLPEYYVNYYDTSRYMNSDYGTPATWFHYDKAEGCDGGDNCKYYTQTWECEGFARYAHDRYLHNELTNNPSYGDWFALYPCSSQVNFTGLQVVADFFSQLNTGDYVRYSKENDTTPEDGAHSIVFIGCDGDGFWAYECNQKYTDTETLGDYGCGIHLQYYTYEAIIIRYTGALYYVKHNYNVSPDYEDVTYHIRECTHCVGYLRQKHDVASATIVNAANHRAVISCCGGKTLAAPHTGTVTYQTYSATQHKVSATCCSGYVLANHTFRLDTYNRSVCTGCGYVSGMIIMGLDHIPVII